jgi:adenine-specific DNA-methyltransferase
LKSHFEKNKTELIQAKIKYKTPNKPYYFLHRERVEKFFKLGDKIICPTRALSNTFLYTENEYYVSRACFVIKSDRINLKYLTGIFNSKLVYFWLDNRGKKLGNMFQIDKEPLLQIPIYKTEDKKLESKLIELVDKMIDLKQKHATTLSDNSKESIANQIKSTDYHIDKLVYELYGLTEDEIKIIEN